MTGAGAVAGNSRVMKSKAKPKPKPKAAANAEKTAVVAKKTAEKAVAVAGKKGKEAVEGVAKKAVAASSASAPSKSPGKKSPGKIVSPTKKAVEEDHDEDEEEDSDDANVVSSSSEDRGGQGATVGKSLGQGVDNVINAGAKVLAGRAPWSGNDGGRARKVSFGLSLGGLVPLGLGRGFLFCFVLFC